MSGTHTDITERKILEQAQKEAAVVFESSYEGIMVVSSENLITKVNAAFSRITGYSAEEAIGQPTSLLSSGQHDEAFYQAMWHSVHEHDFWRGEIWNKRKNGEIYAEYLTITAIRNKKGVTTHYLANFNDITSHKIAQKQIHEMAYHDPLTHLANRVLLLENIQNAFIKQLASHHYAALIFIDLDYFKELNDQHGHDAGDMLLIQVAKRLQESIRQSDTVARLGGDEFVILLRDDELEHKDALKERLEHAQVKAASLAGREYCISFSVGYADSLTTPFPLLYKVADKAMYQQKQFYFSTLETLTIIKIILILIMKIF